MLRVQSVHITEAAKAKIKFIAESAMILITEKALYAAIISLISAEEKRICSRNTYS